ncbi:S-adenosylmethionine-dependent methyltransferase [Nautilia profundicola AmH]|uniref:S-adenosylmethionine-dependent methyltransferase n=1 Tax=Nautilia profundicola (strain ATCC BAA-1463 / DSM 18972 / AmH) TaxID=598659 RepID=B9L6C9_NAUPA|nr:class I SAM-dependent methyltransferase [Nautilia profundicola]ACM93725.1 S-adenosylmethionine-dependent methyltransferase [Nautilia profundicola AmH]
MKNGKTSNRFDKDAITWDDLPRRINLAKAVVNNIIPHLKGNEKVLEFGCGTGLVGINIAPYVQDLKGIDTSAKMVEKFNEKAQKLNLNAKAYQKDIFEINESFDVVISSMTLHHIKNLNALNEKLKSITNRVFLADLVKEDGTFHTRGNDDVEHFGFDIDELREYFKGWNLDYKIIHLIKKHSDFPVFLLELKK